MNTVKTKQNIEHNRKEYNFVFLDSNEIHTPNQCWPCSAILNSLFCREPQT